MGSKSPVTWGRRAFRDGRPREYGDRFSPYNREEFRRGWDEEAARAPMVSVTADPIPETLEDRVVDHVARGLLARAMPSDAEKEPAHFKRLALQRLDQMSPLELLQAVSGALAE